MLISKPASEFDIAYQETYASAARSSQAILTDISALTDDFSLCDESIGEFEFADDVN